MSIERYGEEYVPTCDWCGAELPTEYMFTEAVESKCRHGWRSVKDIDAGWLDLCPGCWQAYIEKDF